METTNKKEYIFLVSNYWEWKARAFLSLWIRMATCGPNHLSLREGYMVREMVGSSTKWILKKIFGKEVSYKANEGCGFKESSIYKWLNHTNRKVIVLRSKQPFRDVVVDEGYGYLDLIQAFLHIIRRVWLLIGHDWNGISGTKSWIGTFCSEWGGKKIGLLNPYRMFPINFLSLKYSYMLEYVGEFTVIDGVVEFLEGDVELLIDATT